MYILVPTAAPQSVSGVNKSSTEITVTWQKVVGQERNGIILGFRVYFKAVGEFAVDTTEKVEVVNGGDAVQKVLESLEKFMNYNITVLAFTSKGDGPNSSVIRVRTDQDRKFNTILSCIFYDFNVWEDTSGLRYKLVNIKPYVYQSI